LKLQFEQAVVFGDAEGISLRSRNQGKKTKMNKAKSQSAGSTAKKNSPKKEEVRGRQTDTDGGLQPLSNQKHGKPRLTTVPRDNQTTTVPRDVE
jgi:hypothetical protein